MQFSTLTLSTIATAVLASGPVSFNLQSRNMPSNNLASYIMKPIQESLDDLVDMDMGKRDNSVDTNLTLTPSYNFYITNMSIGNPKQEVQVGFDTGSPYMWVYGPEGSYENAEQFYPEKSKTFKYEDRNFTASYGAGFLTGKWGTDKLYVGEDELETFPFGVIDKFQVSAGVPGLIGIGPGPKFENKSYSNVPEAFYKEGVTKSPLFSVFLDNSTNNGGVIFGGHDPSKYTGNVYEYDIVEDSPQEQNFYYQLRVDSLALAGEPYNVRNTALLDTGSPFFQLPPGFVRKIGKKYNLTEVPKYQAWYVGDNSTLNGDDEVTLELGKFKANIPLKDLLVPGEYLWVKDGPANVKALAIMGAPSYVLGDAFFKHVYTAFDSYNKKIYLAQSTNNFDVDESEELENGQGIPNAVPGRDPASTTMASQATNPPAMGGGPPPAGNAAAKLPASSSNDGGKITATPTPTSRVEDIFSLLGMHV